MPLFKSIQSNIKFCSNLLSKIIISRLDFLPLRKATQARQRFVKLVFMEEISVISITYEIYKKLIGLNIVIDKKYRFTLSEPVVVNCAKVLEQLIFAKNAPKPLKAAYIINADAAAELTALNLRAILELKLANETNVLKIQALLSEARRQIGGWRKSVQ